MKIQSEICYEICQIHLNDDVAFSFKNIEEIREGDEYTAN